MISIAQPTVTRCTLAPLSRNETAGLIRVLLPTQSDERITPLIEETWKTSEGNPFVVVETMHALEQGALSVGPGELTLPGRVRDVIARRLDRLSVPSKELAALAAVIGREFEFDLLQKASELGERAAADAVEELVRRRVLQSRGDRFEFVHARIRDVAYASLLGPRRVLLHRHVAEALEGLYAIDLEPHRLSLALHYRDAHVWGKAVRYLGDAGIEAHRRSAFRSAATFFEEALRALDQLPETRGTMEEACDLHLQAARVLNMLGALHRTHEHLCAAERLAESLDDPERIGRVANRLSRYFWVVADPDRALASAERAVTLAAELRESTLVAMARFSVGMVSHATGDYGRAIEVLEQNLTVSSAAVRTPSPRTDLSASIVDDMAWLAWCRAERGDFDAALRVAQEAVRSAEAEDRPSLLVGALFALGVAHLRRGNAIDAMTALQQGLDISRGRDIRAWLGPITFALGSACVAVGRIDEALPLLEQAIEQDEALGAMVWRSLFVCGLGEGYLAAGRHAEAENTAARAVHLARKHRERGHEAWCLRFLGETDAAGDRRVDAETNFGKALALAMVLGMRPLVAHCHFGLGKLYRRTGEREMAQEQLTTATTMYREMDMRYWLERAEAELRDGM